AVHHFYDGLDLFLDSHLERIQEFEMARLLAGSDHGVAQLDSSGAALRPVVADYSIFSARCFSKLLDQIDFRRSVVLEAIHAHDHRNPEVARVADVSD